VQAATAECFWYGSFKAAPGRLVLTREPARSSRMTWHLQPLHRRFPSAADRAVLLAAADRALGRRRQAAHRCGYARSRTRGAVERAVPFAFLIRSLTVWYAIAGHAPADVDDRRLRWPLVPDQGQPQPT
jgi:hypothetical protein